MDNRFAIIFSTSKGYMPGANGLLNALEYYGFNNTDIHVLVWEDMDIENEYFKQWPQVNFRKVNKAFWPISKSARWYLLFGVVHEAIRLLEEYNVVLICGADQCPLNNFEEYFDYARLTDRLILGHNEQGEDNFGYMSKEWPYKHTWNIPYADIPCFIPRSQKHVLEKVLEYQSRDGCTLSYMDGLNYAIRDLEVPVMVVPGMLWVYNNTTAYKLTKKDNPISCYFTNLRMNSFHRKYWDSMVCRNYMNGEIAWHNHLIFNSIWNYFNRHCRVKWTEGVEVWNGK